MPDKSFRPDLSFLNKKVKPDRRVHIRRLSVSTNKPPILRSRTREVSSSPSHFQYTQTSSGVSTRGWCLLEGILGPVKKRLSTRTSVLSRSVRLAPVRIALLQ